MTQPKARRAAASILVLALSLLTAASAHAATRARTQPRAVVASPGIAIVDWVRSTVIQVLTKSGPRIDPNGGPH
jgi:hypothetical protein